MLLCCIPACTGLHTVEISQLRVRAESSIFSGTALPRILLEVASDTIAPARIETQYFDSRGNVATEALLPGRYGAVVKISSPRERPIYRYLTLYKTPTPFDWNGVPVHFHMELPASLGAGPHIPLNQQQIADDTLKDILRQSAESSSQLATMLAGWSEEQSDLAATNFQLRDQKYWAKIKQKIGVGNLPCLIHFPSDYEATKKIKRFPVILFLHGSGEAGDGFDELPRVQSNGLGKMLATGNELPKDFPFSVLMPQCPPNEPWSPYELNRLLDDVVQKYPVDTRRIYLTGLSLGGYGVWDLATEFPERFAAIAPVCGGGDPARANRLKDIPIWIFHGEDDPTVPVSEAQTMIAAMAGIGGNIRSTIYPKTSHDSWTKAYREKDLYDWFLQQVKRLE